MKLMNLLRIAHGLIDRTARMSGFVSQAQTLVDWG